MDRMVCALAASLLAMTAVSEPIDLGEVFAPVEVGIPPAAAARDLCRTADGEIRHYGSQMVRGTNVAVYIASRDNGLTWKTHLAAKGDVGAMVKSPWSGDWIYFTDVSGRLAVVRSKIGPGDTKAERKIIGGKGMELRQLIAMKSRKRWIAAFSNTPCEKPRAPSEAKCYHADVMWSDDDGRTWTTVELPAVPGVERLAPGDKRPHWYNDGCEPSVVELKDGTLLLVARTSGPNAAFCRSRDGGETWSAWEIDSRFWQANTMPYFFRLSDGRLLFIWNNTQMLPTRAASETPEIFGGELTGEWEVVFSNRDALHAAISEDDGKTWRGFRELALTAIRNRADFREYGISRENDKSVHQTQALELPGGKVLLAYGQGISARRLVVFDPNWLLETGRHEDFRRGLENISNHLYLKSHAGGIRGWSGHCAYNRMPGAVLVRNPDLPDTIRGDVLKLCRIRDDRLCCDRQGVVWNFPALERGTVSVNCRLAGEGFRMSVTDHWMNPCDETNPALSPISVEINEKVVPKGGGKFKWWHDVAIAFDCAKGEAVLSVDGKEKGRFKFNRAAPAGISYLHLQSLAEGSDPLGCDFRCFHVE